MDFNLSLSSLNHIHILIVSAATVGKSRTKLPYKAPWQKPTKNGDGPPKNDHITILPNKDKICGSN
jgi:hypothetical protein